MARRRSRLVAAGVSVGACAGLVAAMVATEHPVPAAPPAAGAPAAGAPAAGALSSGPRATPPSSPPRSPIPQTVTSAS